MDSKTKQTASFFFEQERDKLQRPFSVMIKTVGPCAIWIAIIVTI